MNSVMINVLVGMSGYLMQRLDKNIDEESEREALARKIRDEIEDKMGRDIPLLDDEKELKVIEESLAMVHKGLSSISNLLITK